MKYLLDTSAFIWVTLGDETALSQSARQILEGKANFLYLSAVSIWEIAIKYSLGKLALSLSPQDLVREVEGKKDFYALPVTHDHAAAVADLPFHHKDPFDRLLIAQARIEGLPILTPDGNFKKYDVEVVW